MITSKDIRFELKELDKVIQATTVKDPAMAALLKSLDVIIKLLTGIRANQVLSMKNDGVELIVPKIGTDQKKEI